MRAIERALAKTLPREHVSGLPIAPHKPPAPTAGAFGKSKGFAPRHGGPAHRNGPHHGTASHASAPASGRPSGPTHPAAAAFARKLQRASAASRNRAARARAFRPHR
jgi:hypothetical protein